MKYYDVFGETGFHSAFMTTYAFSAQAFEDVPFQKLRGAGCRNIAVLADKTMLNMSFADFGPPRYAGALYHLTKVSVGGAFHPKMTLLVGSEKGRLLIGSANLTALGLAGNKELIADLRYTTSDTENEAIIGEALNYLQHHIPADDPWFEAALDCAFRYSPWLREAADIKVPIAQTDLRLLADKSDQTILDQIEAAVAGDEIERLVVISPYWDAKLKGLRRLRGIFGMPPTDILIDPQAAQFPVSGLDDVKVELFKLSDERSSRFVHAKAFIACGKEWDHVISGSMNCSLPALLGPDIPMGNAELGIYKRVECGMALSALNLDGYRQNQLNPGKILPRLNTTNVNDDSRARDGGSFILRGDRLIWTPPAPTSDSALSLQLYDRDGLEIGNPIQIDSAPQLAWSLPNPDIRPRTARVEFDSGHSVPTIIIDLDILSNRTLPPLRGRKQKIADILSGIMYPDLYLLKAIDELETLDNGDKLASLGRVGVSEVEANNLDEQTEFRELSYESFVQARKQAKTQGSNHTLFLTKRQDRAADHVSICLNRLIGLMASDFLSEDEDDLRRQSEIDLRVTELSEEGDDERDANPLEKVTTEKVSKQQVRATAKNIEEAVIAFEERCKGKVGKRINTTDLVRLRILLQVILRDLYT